MYVDFALSGGSFLGVFADAAKQLGARPMLSWRMQDRQFANHALDGPIGYSTMSQFWYEHRLDPAFMVQPFDASVSVFGSFRTCDSNVSACPAGQLCRDKPQSGTQWGYACTTSSVECASVSMPEGVADLATGGGQTVTMHCSGVPAGLGSAAVITIGGQVCTDATWSDESGTATCRSPSSSARSSSASPPSRSSRRSRTVPRRRRLSATTAARRLQAAQPVVILQCTFLD